jgi:hypothetical protein
MTAPAAPAASDKVTLWGVLGIIGAFCCWPLGLVFGILCFTEAKKVGKPPTLAYIAFAVLALGLILNIIVLSTGALSNLTG